MQPSPPKRCTLTADLVLELGQLNKGESIHALRGWLVSVEDGRIRRRQLEDQ